MDKMAAFAAVLAIHAAVAGAATVDAGEITTVDVDSPLYDTRVSADGGCDPSGCSGDLTRVSPIQRHTFGMPFIKLEELILAGSICPLVYFPILHWRVVEAALM